jgi:hypothetical protein
MEKICKALSSEHKRKGAVHRPATVVKKVLCTDLPLLLKLSAHCDVGYHHTFMADEFCKTRIISGKKKKVIIFLPALFEISYKILKQHLVHGPE